MAGGGGAGSVFPGFHLSSPPARVGTEGTFDTGIWESVFFFASVGVFRDNEGCEWRCRDIPEAAVCTGDDGGAL